MNIRAWLPLAMLIECCLAVLIINITQYTSLVSLFLIVVCIIILNVLFAYVSLYAKLSREQNK